MILSAPWHETAGLGKDLRAPTAYFMLEVFFKIIVLAYLFLFGLFKSWQLYLLKFFIIITSKLLYEIKSASRLASQEKPVIILKTLI